MVKNIFSQGLVLIFLFSSLLFPPRLVRADFTLDDRGIQKIHQNSMPQINSSGKIQYSYTSDSFFPLALYWSDTRYLQQIKDAGFNTLYSAVWDPFPHHTTIQDLDRLNQYGIKVIQQIQDEVAASVSQNNWDILQNKINVYKNHPAVLAWYFDEMATRYITPAQLSDAYTRVKALDPNRAVMAEVGISGGAGPSGCIPFTVDMSNIYSYNIYDEKSGLGDLVYSIDSYMKRGCPYPLFIILQAFKQGEDVSYAAWKFMPTPEQIRGQMYTAIVHGATGLWLFVGFVEQSTGEKLLGLFPGTQQWNAASVANHEIEVNKRIFLSKTSTDQYHLEWDGRDCYWFETGCEHNNPPIHTILKDTGEVGIRYLLTVNLDSYQSVNARFTFTNKLTRVISLFDNRAVTSSDTQFTDNFEPFGVRLYRIELFGANPQPTSTPTSTPLPGDLSGDDIVNSADFDLLMNDFGKPNYQGVADLNGDGKVDIFDFNTLVGNFGKNN